MRRPRVIVRTFFLALVTLFADAMEVGALPQDAGDQFRFSGDSLPRETGSMPVSINSWSSTRTRDCKTET